ncbi:MAG TPA: TIGR03621 family F420-dependent LLM class oxidoreductase [Candidatus Limnocylindria bacterium]|nr:TIGR03621 family F420-dependent LLM class oxidoreductase [Candidatus Limnocylindria bacterium]
MPRPFRFLADARGIASLAELAETVRRAEDIGIDTLVVPDHLIPQLGPVPAMAAIAAISDRLRVSAFVFNNDLRHPAVLAQDLASIDVLSGGRLDVAIGAGWNRPEYEAIGIGFDPTPVRQARLSEAIAVLKGCFGDAPFSFAGEHYTITDFDSQPKPVQRPHPPFLIGGGGKRTLTLAAREAQIVGLAPRILPVGAADPNSVTFEGTREKIGWVREAAGDRFDDLELNIYPSMTGVSITDEPLKEAQEVADRVSQRSGVPVSAEELLDSPHIFINTVGGFVEKFRRLRDELGISSIMVGEVDELAPVVERLAGT